MTHAAAFVAATTRRFSTNTPQRACATEGGDEHTVVRRALSVRDPALWQSAEAHCPSGLDERFVSHWAASVAARMRKAMSAPVIESRKASASTQMLTYQMFVINARVPPKRRFRDPRFLTAMSCAIAARPL